MALGKSFSAAGRASRIRVRLALTDGQRGPEPCDPLPLRFNRVAAEEQGLVASSGEQKQLIGIRAMSGKARRGQGERIARRSPCDESGVLASLPGEGLSGWREMIVCSAPLAPLRRRSRRGGFELESISRGARARRLPVRR